jgi:hypothetical protein
LGYIRVIADVWTDASPCEERIERVFALFYQGVGVLTDVGLGLAVEREVLVIHGSLVTVANGRSWRSIPSETARRTVDGPSQHMHFFRLLILGAYGRG